ncbi:MAG: hypothetical protein ACD_81C00209G0002 [uncultured bacterium]|uniref:2'-5' RNA ligase n=1 Tax=Candidatus Wolfebacteria bacterium GW2011_GWC2_39_22 TaxID=1619013 RepID=A0A0G0NB44_9BACT|nr:MAG: hypothetical protein ACD_81C00209G0002 [uncultured bacterium]KKR12678.1 MAG: hypothetical protein UT41_C0001G0222 [Candidatus Wolfebacteria bacterium GW2011_GWC2_39_22]HBI25658.1 hypothetical protein [Candidatus Wolfebacteria bacterium]
MKNYTISLLPDNNTRRAIEEFRINTIGQVLVDSMSPHVTLKRRFVLNDKFSEEDLIHYFKTLRYKKFEIDFAPAEMLADALVLVGKSSELSIAHNRIVEDLQGKILTKNPEWEMENYVIHLTLLRGYGAEVTPPILERAMFDTIALYEIDPGPERSYVNKLATIELN